MFLTTLKLFVIILVGLVILEFAIGFIFSPITNRLDDVIDLLMELLDKEDGGE